MKTKSTKIYGSPGTGKTSTLIDIIVNSDLPLNKIAYCTFGKHALQDMVDRMERRGKYSSDIPYFKTIHAMNFKLLGIRKDQVADKRLDEFCKEKKFRMTLKFKPTEETPYADYKVAGTDVTLDDIFHAQMQEDRTDLRPFNFVHPKLKSYAGAYMHFKHAYFDWMREHDYIDFIGMIERGIAQNVYPPVDLLCIDEWQDLNALQIKQVQMWMEQIPTSYHAGDDDQCIFEFAGADPSAFLDLVCDDEVVLGETFRLPNDILALSQSIIKRNKIRKDKNIHSQKDTGGVYFKTLGSLCDMLQKLPPEEDVVFLVRNNFVIIPLMSDLADYGIPMGGYRKERLAIKLMQRGFSVDRFDYDDLDALTSGSIFPALRYFKRGSKTKIKKAMTFIPEGGFTREKMAEFGLTENFFKDLQEKNCAYLNIPDDKFRYITKLFEKYGYNPKPVEITTIHQFKGREADTVILVPDITKACYESEHAHGYDMSVVEGERRNWYTAITRAQKRLIMLNRTNYSTYKTRVMDIIAVFVENMKKATS